VVIVAATVVAALTGSIVAAPYLLVRRHRARHASSSVPGAQVVAIESPRVAT
jgi:hypothetical protein